MDLDRSGSDGRSFTLSHRHTYGTTSTGSFPELSVVVLIVVNCLSWTGLPSWTDLAILGRSESITRVQDGAADADIMCMPPTYI